MTQGWGRVNHDLPGSRPVQVLERPPYIPSLSRSGGRKELSGVVRLCWSLSGAPQTEPPSPEEGQPRETPDPSPPDPSPPDPRADQVSPAELDLARRYSLAENGVDGLDPRPAPFEGGGLLPPLCWDRVRTMFSTSCSSVVVARIVVLPSTQLLERFGPS